MKNLIALTGLAGSGKTTAADYLVNAHGFICIKFADPLKSMLQPLGLTLDDIEGEGKERPHPLLCGKTPRFAMQTLGTEWGRDMIGPDLWVNIWTKRAYTALRNNQMVVADDCRFENSAAAVRALGGTIIRLEGRMCFAGPATEWHGSEGLEWKADGEIENDGTIADLHRKLDALTCPPTGRTARYGPATISTSCVG